MADFSQEKVTVARHRFYLPTPTNATELDKMVYAAWKVRMGQLKVPANEVPDDAITVTVEDDNIVLSWEVSVFSS
jgi:hypothetical protein